MRISYQLDLAALEPLREAIDAPDTGLRWWEWLSRYDGLMPALLTAADTIAAQLPRRGLPDSELRRALANYWLHRGKRSAHHGPDCLKCVRTAGRLVDAVLDEEAAADA